jgi:hypothetical protein
MPAEGLSGEISANNGGLLCLMNLVSSNTRTGIINPNHLSPGVAVALVFQPLNAVRAMSSNPLIGMELVDPVT